MQALGLLAVDRHQVLRVVRRKWRVKSDQILALARLSENHLGGCRQFLQFVSGLILNDELKTAERSQPVDCRRQGGKDNGSRDTEQSGTNTVQNRGCRVSVAFALGVGLERNKDESLVRCASRKTEAGYGESSLRFGQIGRNFGNIFTNLFLFIHVCLL